MVDRLDRQILETIANAPSLVRTVTKREIETGVLFPSATSLDIKRNLPGNVSINLVESRLNLLERDRYIFFNDGRWWLTSRGRKEIGRVDESQPEVLQRPVRTILEETFTKHNLKEQCKSDVGDALTQLDNVYGDSRINGEERSRKAMEILNAVHHDRETKEYLESRMDSLSIEIKRLEEELARKKEEKERIKRLIGE